MMKLQHLRLHRGNLSSNHTSARHHQRPGDRHHRKKTHRLRRPRSCRRRPRRRPERDREAEQGHDRL